MILNLYLLKPILPFKCYFNCYFYPVVIIKYNNKLNVKQNVNKSFFFMLCMSSTTMSILYKKYLLCKHAVNKILIT